jgi:hypothetical protein
MNGKSWEREVQEKAGQHLTVGSSNEEQAEQFGACAWVFHKPVLALDVEDGSKPTVTFQYVYMGVRSEFKPGEFSFVFVGLESWKVVVKGTNLRPIYDRINEHRVRRIRKTDRAGFDGTPKDPFIESIEIINVTPEREK